MNVRWVPDVCSRRRIFISYSSEHHPMAEELAQTLKNEGHDVFFDKDSLPPGQEYNERIRSALRLADCCIFLIGRTSLQSGRYMLTEVELTRARWPVPAGRAFPVIVDSDVKPAELPAYLRSVSVIVPKGNLAAEIAATVDPSRRISRLCWACLVCALAAVLASALAIVLWWRPAAPVADVILLPIEKVHFRPGRGPPKDLLAPDAPTDWIESQLTVTAINVAYNRRDLSSASASLRREELELLVGKASYRYTWAYIVDIRREEGCPDDWLCSKESVGVVNLAAGRSSQARETMFLAELGPPLTWRTFIDQVLAPGGPTDITVKLRSHIDISGPGWTRELILESTCGLDVHAARAAFLMTFTPGADPRPVFWQPPCMK
jgi:hypothetical protein